MGCHCAGNGGQSSTHQAKSRWLRRKEEVSMDVEYELVKWFVKEKLPSDVVSAHGLHDSSRQGWRVYGAYFDLLVETKTEFWIVEAKKDWNDHAIYTAAGQLLFYKHLWNTYKENARAKLLKLICLCPFDCSEDAEKFLALYDVQFVKGDVPR